MDFLTIIQIADSALRLATPLLFACLAGLFSERAGIFDIGLEGKILASAFLSAAVAFATGSVWFGLLSGVFASICFSAVHGVASITFRGNQLISGVALNFLASGITVLAAQAWFSQGGRTPPLTGTDRFLPIDLPFALGKSDAEAAGVPLRILIEQANPIQQVYSEFISGHTILVYVALLMVPISWFVLFRTRFGLRLRAVGENPAAVDTAGVSVIKLRYASMAIAGTLCGLSGVYLATGLGAGFIKEMSAGRGYIALAALIFAKWKPVPALGATFLFGLLEAIANRYQNIDLGGVVIPVQFMQALPYILTVVILAGFVGSAIAPKAGGQPYVKER
jgi:simple sugar transport system permease protein